IRPTPNAPNVIALISISVIASSLSPLRNSRDATYNDARAKRSRHSLLLSPGDTLAIETELRELIDRNLPADAAPRVSAFAARLFGRESTENRDRVPAKRRLALVQSAFDFFSVRTDPVIARVETISGDDNDSLTVVETVTADCPFIVDSLLEYFHHLGATVRTILHPIFKVTRDKQGRIASFEQSSSAERGESFVHAELELTPTPEQARQIERDVISILTEVRAA